MRVFEDLDPSKDDVVFVGYSSAEHGQCVVEQRRRKDVDPVTGAPAPMESRQVYLDPTTHDFASPLAVILRREAGGALLPVDPAVPPDALISPPAPSWQERITRNPASVGLLGVLLLGSGYVAGRRLGRGLGNSGAYAAASSRRMDDLERRVVNEVQLANRGRTREIDTFKREILSSLSAHATAGTVIGIEDRVACLIHQLKEAKEASQKDIGKVLGQIEASNRDRRTEFHGFRSEIMGELQAVNLNEMEARLVDRMDMFENSLWEISAKSEVASARVKDPLSDQSRGSGTHPSDFDAFRTEVMDQLQRMEHAQKKQAAQSAVPPKVDAPSVASAAPIAPRMDEARLRQVLQSAMEEVIEAKMVKPAEAAQPEAMPKTSPIVSSDHDEERSAQAIRSAVEDVQAASARSKAVGPGPSGGRTINPQERAQPSGPACAEGPRSELFLPSPQNLGMKESERVADVLDYGRFAHQLHRLFIHYWPEGSCQIPPDSLLIPANMGCLTSAVSEDEFMRCLSKAGFLLRAVTVHEDIVCGYSADTGIEWELSIAEVVEKSRTRDHDYFTINGQGIIRTSDVKAAVEDLMIEHARMCSWIRQWEEVPQWDVLAELEKCFDSIDMEDLQSSACGIPRLLEFKLIVTNGTSPGMVIRYDVDSNQY